MKRASHQIISSAIIDFMAYARKVLIKKPNLKTYKKFFIRTWNNLAFFPSHAIDWILFLMCTKKTGSEQVSENDKRQLKVKIKIIISGFDQPLPAEIDRFWSVSTTLYKVGTQQG